jgi:4-hydroxyphenylpyruvate dioxygenase
MTISATDHEVHHVVRSTNEEQGDYSSTHILGFDYVHHYVGNAKHSAQHYASLYGFKIVGYQGPETGVRDRVSYLLCQNDVMFVISAGLVPEHPIWDFVRTHCDGIGEISVRVKDVAAAFDFAKANGAVTIREPVTHNDEYGRFEYATIQIYGDTEMTFLNRDAYHSFLPNYEPYRGPQFARGACRLMAIDHIVGNVPEGEMDKWALFFENTLDLETFIHFDKGDISTQYSALVSKVVRSKNSAVKFPINEPAEGLKKSQIEEYLEVNRGAGVQHVAIASDNIIETIKNLRGNGVEFIDTPDSYYEVISERAKIMDERLEEIRELNILFDDEGEGYLLQLFTQPVSDRPTLFFEFIQRKGSEGFGQNNFQSLFESIEREQAKRGNL